MRIKKVAYLLLLFLGVLQVSFAQEKTVSGVVKDENLEPMLGASVIVKGILFYRIQVSRSQGNR